MARGKSKGKHAAPDGVGNVGSYGITSGWGTETWYDHDTGLLDDDSGLDSLPLVPEISTFDIESGAHVSTQVPPDDARFGKAWRDPEPERPTVVRHQYDDDGSGHNIPGEGRSRSRWRPMVALLVILVAVGVLGAFVAYGAELWGGRRVPDLTGVSERAAKSELERKGLRVSVTSEPVDDAVGFVLSSDPAAGMRVEAGGTVTIVVGSSRILPRVVGLAEADAREALASAGVVDLKVVYQASEEAEGTVISLTPPEGSAFTSRDVVTLTIAQAYTVPDVIGVASQEAQATVSESGLTATVVEISAPGSSVGTVVETEPAVGTKLEAGSEVTLKVAAGTPSSFEHVTEYFGASSVAISEYVIGQGFSLRSGWLNERDEAQASFQSPSKGGLIFTSRPFSHSFETWKGGSNNNVLAKGYQYLGVRWALPTGMLPDGASELSDGAMAALLSMCMLSDQGDSCDQDSIVVPAGTVKSSARFRCASGEVSGLVWTALLSNSYGTVHAAVTCAPRSLYDGYDLSPYGGRICCMVAYADMYTE